MTSDSIRSLGFVGSPHFQKPQAKLDAGLLAKILFFLLQPNRQLEERISAVKRALNWGGKCIALHVRHGWRSRFNSEVGLDKYLARAVLLNITNVLLITEDQAVINATESFPSFNWMFTKYPRNNPHDIGVEMQKGNMDPTEEAYNALINLLLSSECDYFVGRTNSTWYRLMLMLAYGRYGYLPPWDNVGEDWGHGGLRKWGFFGTCTLGEIRKEVVKLNQFLPNRLHLDARNIY